MSLPCMQQLRAYGVDKLLEGVYGKYMCKPAEEGWDITLEFDLEAMGNADIGTQSLIQELSRGVNIFIWFLSTLHYIVPFAI